MTKKELEEKVLQLDRRVKFLESKLVFPYQPCTLPHYPQTPTTNPNTFPQPGYPYVTYLGDKPPILSSNTLNEPKETGGSDFPTTQCSAEDQK